MYANGLRQILTRASKRAKLPLRWPPLPRRSNSGQDWLVVPNFFRVRVEAEQFIPVWRQLGRDIQTQLDDEPPGPVLRRMTVGTKA